jgi:hypothetical protein
METNFKHLLRVHEDIMTLPEVIADLYKEYKELGYAMLTKYPSSFAYQLEDKTIVFVFWKDGKIYEDVALLPDQRINPVFEDSISEDFIEN